MNRLIIYLETKTVFVKEIVKYFESFLLQCPFRMSLNASEENSNRIMKMLVNVLFDVLSYFVFYLLFENNFENIILDKHIYTSI